MRAVSSLVLRFVKRDAFYHKIQYSKIFKFDVSAAVIGIVSSTIFSMLAMATVGTCSVDLSDLCLVFYYVFVAFLVLKNIIYVFSTSAIKNFFMYLAIFLIYF